MVELTGMLEPPEPAGLVGEMEPPVLKVVGPAVAPLLWDEYP